MGKDKKPAAAPAAAPAGGKNAATPAVADAKAGGGRGHRQRGAGTVITAKPAVVTDDGIVLKAHERLPAQILHEYCQRENRPIPKYFREPPGIRFKVVLADPKNSRQDLFFCPVQSFESETMARHYAALLALFHVQKSYPLERKLPEPFCTTWLQMIRNNSADGVAPGKEAKSSSSAAASSNNNTAANQQASAKSSAVAATSSSLSAASTTSAPAAPAPANAALQWLCDSCATPNFLTNMNGIIRTKCFRCQTPKPEVVSMTTAPSHANAKAAVVTSSNAHIPKAERKPQVVLDLQAKAQYVSQAERDAEIMNRKLRQTSNMTYFEALKNSNPLNAIHIPVAMRDLLEKLLGLGAMKIDNETIVVAKKEAIQPKSISTPKQKQINAAVIEKKENLAELTMSEQCLYTAGWTVANVVALRQSPFFQQLPLSDENIGEIMHMLLLSVSKNSLAYAFVSSEDSAVSSDKVNLYTNIVSSYTNQISDAASTALLSSSDIAEKRAVISEEMEALLAILGEEIPVQLLSASAGGQSLVVSGIPFSATCSGWISSRQSSTQGDDSSSSKSSREQKQQTLKMTMFIPAHCAYPNDSPMVMISVDRLFSSSAQCMTKPLREIVQRMNVYVNEKVRFEWKGAIVAYEIVSCLQHVDVSELLSLSLDHVTGKELNQSLRAIFWQNEDEDEEEVAKTVAKEEESDDKEVVALEALSIADETTSTTSETATSVSTAAVSHSTTVTTSNNGRNNRPNSSNKKQASSSNAAHLQKSGTHGHPFWRRSTHPTTATNTTNTAVFNEQMVPIERQRLPAWQQRGIFLSAIAQQDCVIVTGETGCGKTTQIPQYLHETYPDAKILICQPRRLAATGVAQRVTEEVDMMLNNAHHHAHNHHHGPSMHHKQQNSSSTTIPPPPPPTAQQVKGGKSAHHPQNPVGYMVKGDSHITAQTRIAFVTYGVLLRRLQEDPTLASVDFVILDEVHERGMDSDFCLALLIEALQQRNNSAVPDKKVPALKLILMSATISTDTFRNYLLQHLYPTTHPSNNAHICPIIDIPGRTFPVSEFFKQEFEKFVSTLSLNKPTITSTASKGRAGKEEEEEESEYSSDDNEEIVGDAVISGGADHPTSSSNNSNYSRREIVLNQPNRKKEVDYDLLIRLVFTLILGRQPPANANANAENEEENPEKWQKADGCILIFLPGVPEITKVLHYLRTYWPSVAGSTNRPPRLELLALHGNLSPADQRQVFVTYPPHQNVIKIVAATNVAEASVTIPDVTVVIDTCRVKEMSYDSDTHAWQLSTLFAAKDSLRQRKGRAGRVQQGRCYRLITKNTFDSKLAAISTPEILRMPLDNVLLQTFAMVNLAQENNVKSTVNIDHNTEYRSNEKEDQYQRCLELLAKCPSPPTLSAITRAKDALVSLQALMATSSYSSFSTNTNNNSNNSSVSLTALGVLLAKLPMIPRIGKLLIYGRLLQCTLPAICIAATLSSASGNKPIFLTAPAANNGSGNNSMDRAESLQSFQNAIHAVKERILRENPVTRQELILAAHDANNNSSNGSSSNSSSGLSSDYYVIAQLIIKFLHCHHNNNTNNGNNSMTAARRHFCKQHYLHFERMQDIAQAVGELIEDIRDLGLLHAGLVPQNREMTSNALVPSSNSSAYSSFSSSRYLSKQELYSQMCDIQHPLFNRFAKQPRLLAALFVAGLYPQVMQIQRPPKKFIEVMGAAVERDMLAKEIAFYVPTNHANGSEGPLGANLTNVNKQGSNNNEEDEDDGAHTAGYMTLPSTDNKRERDLYFSACIIRRADVTSDRVQRVFIHPSSINFANTSFQVKHKVISNYVLYGEKQCVITGYDATTKTEQLKVYVKDTSEVSPLALILFGGDVQVLEIPSDVSMAVSNEENGGVRMGKRVLITVDQWIRFYASARDARMMLALKKSLNLLLQDQLQYSSLADDESSSMSSHGNSTVTTHDSHNRHHHHGSHSSDTEWSVHPLIETACALLDSAVTMTGAPASGISVHSNNK